MTEKQTETVIEDKKENPSSPVIVKRKKIINEDSNKKRQVNSKYLLNKTNQEKLDKIRKEKEKEIIEQCTFKPSINTKYKLKEEWKNEDCKDEKGSSNNSSKSKTPHDEALERMQFFLEKSKSKIEKEREKNTHKEVEQCSFAPSINREVPEFQDTYIKGTKMYIERQMKSQQIKNERNDKLNPNYNKIYENLFKKKEKSVVNKNLKKKEYQMALDILHNELISK